MSGRDYTRQLIEAHQSLVRSLAGNIHRKLCGQSSVTLEDLIAYGQVGLAEAARDFDPERGNQFSTFAYYRVRGSIYDGLSKMTWMSRSQYHRARYEQMSTSVLETERTETVKAGQADDDSGMRSVRNVSRALAVVYLSTQYGGTDGDSAEMILPNPDGSEVTEVAIKREINEALNRCIDALPPKAGALIRATYFEGLTLQQAGHNLGLSKSWASRLHARTLQELGRSLRVVGVTT